MTNCQVLGAVPGAQRDDRFGAPRGVGGLLTRRPRTFFRTTRLLVKTGSRGDVDGARPRRACPARRGEGAEGGRGGRGTGAGASAWCVRALLVAQ